MGAGFPFDYLYGDIQKSDRDRVECAVRIMCFQRQVADSNNLNFIRHFRNSAVKEGSL